MSSSEICISPNERFQPIAGQSHAGTQLFFRRNAQGAINIELRSLIIAMRGSKLSGKQ